MLSPDFLKPALQRRQGSGLLRTLQTPNQSLIDFASNDYLGFARSEALQQRWFESMASWQEGLLGATGSRLLTGNNELCERLEQQIAKFHYAEAGLLFNSGYDANLSLMATLAQPGDTLLYDEWIHASIRDGARLSRGRNYSFKHNDLEHLRQKLKQSKGNRFIIVESVYSMDGDFAPLEELVDLCEAENAYLIVDEAHATGVFGEEGRGYVNELGLEPEVFARIHTFGKALGCHGAIIVGPALLRDYLINYARPFIYTTALPPHSLLALQAAYEALQESTPQQQHLQTLIQHFQERSKTLDHDFLNSQSPIQGLIHPGNKEVKQQAQRLQKRGFDIRPILSPTVPKGTERLRIGLHAHNTIEEVDQLLECLGA